MIIILGLILVTLVICGCETEQPQTLLMPFPGQSSGGNGTVGPQGPAGKDGLNGTNGVNGTNGATGSPGTNGKDGLNGTNGITYNISAIEFKGGNISLNWTNGITFYGPNLTGPQGIQGIKGNDGTNGTNGLDVITNTTAWNREINDNLTQAAVDSALIANDSAVRSVLSGGTGVSISTGTIAVVLNNTPTISRPNIANITMSNRTGAAWCLWINTTAVAIRAGAC